jgi:membrane protease YdiL (CAAX protease family)
LKKTQFTIAAIFFGFLLAGFWAEVRRLDLTATVGGHVFSTFLSFSLLLAVEWFFAFGVADSLDRRLSTAQPRSRLVLRSIIPVLLVVPYLVFAIPRGTLDYRYAAAMALLPVVLSLIVESTHRAQTFVWQDAVVLLTLAVILEQRLLSPAWPFTGLGALPKIYLADLALYLYLVVRRLNGVGYSFAPRIAAFYIGIREWLFFLPFALGIGFTLHFIKFSPRHPSILHVITALLVVFLLTAVPEEIFFRGILQNLLEPRVGQGIALAITAALFGLSHFSKGATFNWRYVIIAGVAGIFYGRAWRAKRQLVASSTTHTLVDVVWGLWFR